MSCIWLCVYAVHESDLDHWWCSPSICFSPPPISMPAIRTSLPSTLVNANTQHCLHQSYEADLALSTLTFNPTHYLYIWGSHGHIPYPRHEDICQCFNHAVIEDDNFANTGDKG